MPDWAVVANITDPMRTKLRMGARVVIVDPGNGSGGERMQVRGLSIGGRRITVWVRRESLTNFRAKFAEMSDGAIYETKERAEAAARAMQVRK